MQFKQKIQNNKILLYFYQHPKITTFFVLYFGFMILYFIFSDFLAQFLVESGVFGIFISGVLYTFGVTGGVSIFTILEQAKYYDPLTISIVAGVGAGLIDLLTFRYVEKSFVEELKKISDLRFFRFIENIKIKNFSLICNKYVYTTLGLLLVASPLSDEFGIYFLGKVKQFKNIHIFIIGFIINFIGIYIIASIG